MNAMTTEMGSLSFQMRDLSEDQLSLRQDFVGLAAHGRETSAGLRRLSELLVKAVGSTSDNLDELEARIAKLEKKTG
jgi:hypothetical protein